MGPYKPGGLAIVVTAEVAGYVDRINAAIVRLERLAIRLAISQICGILEAARRVRA